MQTPPVRLGRFYTCHECGARILVIRAKSQALKPVCCNVYMVPGADHLTVRFCPVCGTEVAVMKGSEHLELSCCNRIMKTRESVIPEAA